MPKQLIYHKMARCLKIVLSLLFFSLSTAGFSLDQDKYEPINLSADNIQLDNKNHKIYLVKDVKVQQGTTKLIADSLVITTDDKNALKSLHAKGNTKQQAFFKTKPHKNKEPLDAWADNIYYFPKTNLIKLIGNAKVLSQGNELSASLIIYDTVQEKVISNGDHKEPVKIILKTEKKI